MILICLLFLRRLSLFSFFPMVISLLIVTSLATGRILLSMRWRYVYIFVQIDTKQWALNPGIRRKPTPNKCAHFLNRFTQHQSHRMEESERRCKWLLLLVAIKSNPTNQSHAFWLPFVCLLAYFISQLPSDDARRSYAAAWATHAGASMYRLRTTNGTELNANKYFSFFIHFLFLL